LGYGLTYSSRAKHYFAAIGIPPRSVRSFFERLYGTDPALVSGFPSTVFSSLKSPILVLVRKAGSEARYARGQQYARLLEVELD